MFREETLRETSYLCSRALEGKSPWPIPVLCLFHNKQTFISIKQAEATDAVICFPIKLIGENLNNPETTKFQMKTIISFMRNWYQIMLLETEKKIWRVWQRKISEGCRRIHQIPDAETKRTSPVMKFLSGRRQKTS